ncbi:MAG: hypothetical protein ABNH32_00005, partial [Marinobacter sp.]
MRADLLFPSETALTEETLTSARLAISAKVRPRRESSYRIRACLSLSIAKSNGAPFTFANHFKKEMTH